MTQDAMHETWDLWYPGAAARGLPFARGRLRATDVLLVHAAPDLLDVAVRDDAGTLLAEGAGLRRTAETPMARLVREGQGVTRSDVWPSDADIGTPVILAGGEVGILKVWWHAPDQQQWRWSVEFYNHR
jgi:hypothetical protein